MSDSEQSRPLTRRELRLREMAAAGAQSESEVDERAATAVTPPPSAAAAETAAVEPSETTESVAAVEAEIEISLFDEQGRPRSRRELRELREQALAAEVEVEPETELVESESEPELAELDEEPADSIALDEEVAEQRVELSEAEQLAQLIGAPDSAEAGGPEDAAAAFDEMISEVIEEVTQSEGAEVTPAEPERAAFDISELVAEMEAEEPGEVAPEPDASELEAVLDVTPIGEASSVASEPAAEVEPVEEPEPVVEAEPIEEPEPVEQSEPTEEAEPSEDQAVSDEALEFVAESVAAAPLETETVSEQDIFAGPPVAAPTVEPPVPAQKSGYSFPDIAPLDDISVFDDPSGRLAEGANSKPNAGSGGFDDLINRAVAQEGAAGSSNTSALILPSMPDSESLSGPIGETGELFVTGSIRLPKSLGETGSHSAIHDPVEVEALEDLNLGEAPQPTGIMAPVSATRAVSAKAHASGPLVAEAGKDKSKLPVVLISVGGVLVVGAVGIVIWAASNGVFG